MKRSCFFLAAAMGCCSRPGDGPVEHIGTPPPGADVVVSIAKTKCKIQGKVTWEDGPFSCLYTEYPKCMGWQKGEPACEPLDARVMRVVPVTQSALAWELSNYCLDNEDGPAAQAMAQEINAEAAKALGF